MIIPSKTTYEEIENYLIQGHNYTVGGHIDIALSFYERAFSLVSPQNPIAIQVSSKVLDIVKRNLVPVIPNEDIDRVFPARAFSRSNLSAHALRELIDWKKRNNDVGPESQLQMARWFNQLGESDQALKLCDQSLNMSNPHDLELYFEKAIAYFQAEKYAEVKLVLYILKKANNDELDKYIKIMKREVFLRECLQLETLSADSFYQK